LLRRRISNAGFVLLTPSSSAYRSGTPATPSVAGLASDSSYDDSRRTSVRNADYVTLRATVYCRNDEGEWVVQGEPSEWFTEVIR